MDAWQSRLIAEQAALADRLGKLEVHMRGDLFDSLHEEDRQLLTLQFAQMTAYNSTLLARIARAQAVL